MGTPHDALLDRRVAWVTLSVATVVWAVLAAWLVPWEWLPGRLRPVEAAAAFSSEHLDRAEAYVAQVRVLADVARALGLVVAGFLGLTSRGRRLARNLLGRLPWWVAVPLAVLCFEVAVRSVQLPSAWGIRQHRLEEGLTNQSAAGWWTDQVLSMAVTWCVLSVGLLVLVAGVRRWPRRWYLPVGAGALVATYLVSLAYPVFVEPLFNDFTTLEDGALRARLIQIADDQGVDVGEVLVADASRRTTTLNAYVSGLGDTKRLVLYDTLVADAPEDEVVAVAAHEVAHAARHDVLVGTSLAGVGAVVGVALLALTATRSSGRTRVDLTRPGGVWFVLAWVMVVSLLLSPVESTISRAVETRADVDALETTQDPGAFRALHVRLAERSLADPTPPAWRQVWWGSHPTVLERLALLREHPVE